MIHSWKIVVSRKQEMYLWIQLAIPHVTFVIVHVLLRTLIEGIQVVLEVALSEIYRFTTCKQSQWIGKCKFKGTIFSSALFNAQMKYCTVTSSIRYSSKSNSKISTVGPKILKMILNFPRLRHVHFTVGECYRRRQLFSVPKFAAFPRREVRGPELITTFSENYSSKVNDQL